MTTMKLENLIAKLKEPILTRPARRMTLGELETYLEKAADILRGNVDHSEFRGYVFALLFYKRINDRYEEEVRELTSRLGDEALARDPSMHNFVVPQEASWDTVVRTPKGALGQALNDAMLLIERANQPKFDGILTNKIDFNKQDELPRDKLVNLINHFSGANGKKVVLDRAHVPDDLFGSAYEYLIRNFASKAGKSSGEFYTPAEVGFLMSEMIEPDEGHHICDWSHGSGGLLLQCIRYVRKHGRDANRLFLHGQESNVATYNISRINMILHGITSWDHKREDSLRNPLHLDAANRLKQFDRIIMNPPFSLEDWGYDVVQGGDKYGRMTFGLPPASNGDYAWLQHVVKSLRDPDPSTGGEAGKGIIVMSQGVLFRGQPEQTIEEDGQNQKADAEYTIRRGFIEADLIECVVVLTGKLFYGNGVPACLILFNKAKAPERKGKVLMIWASRDYEKANPQNLLRPSDLMRVLVPWRAYGDLEKARELVAEHETLLLREVEENRDSRLADIEDAYGPVLATLDALNRDREALVAIDLKVNAVWEAASEEHPFFSPLAPLKQEIERVQKELAKADKSSKTALKAKLYAAKAEYDKERKAITEVLKERRKKVARAVKDLGKLQEDRDSQENAIQAEAERKIVHLHEAAADLMRICSDPTEAQRYFAVVEAAEIDENEFNLNVPRYVDTFEPEKIIPLERALTDLKNAGSDAQEVIEKLEKAISSINIAPTAVSK